MILSDIYLISYSTLNYDARSTTHQITVTVTATCRERHWMGRYSPKHVEQFADVNKLYIVF